MKTRVETGRTFDRRRLCLSCQARIRIGQPRTDGGRWPERLRLSDEQLDLLLLAAAELDAMSAEAREPVTLVEFVDWLRPDVGRRAPGGAVRPDPAPEPRMAADWPPRGGRL